jgi:hypothetical protein
MGHKVTESLQHIYEYVTAQIPIWSYFVVYISLQKTDHATGHATSKKSLLCFIENPNLVGLHKG